MKGLCEESTDCKILKETENHVERELIFQNFFQDSCIKFKVVEDKIEDSTIWKVFDEAERELSYLEVVQLFAFVNLKRHMNDSCQA